MMKSQPNNHSDPYGFIYKTILTNGRYYIGQHKISNKNTLDPNYFGSGVIIKDYIKSHGRQSLTRKILEFAFDPVELNVLEDRYVTSDVLADPLNLNLDKGGKHINSRSPDVCKRIGESISKMRKQYPTRWKSRHGKDNNKSNNWKAVSPSGEIFEFCGGLGDFCKSMNISVNTIKKAVAEGWIPRRGSCSGWRVFNVDTGKGTYRDTSNHGPSHSGHNNPWYKKGKIDNGCSHK